MRNELTTSSFNNEISLREMKSKLRLDKGQHIRTCSATLYKQNNTKRELLLTT